MTQAGGYELSRAIERLVSGLVPPFMMKEKASDAIDHGIELVDMWASDLSWSHQAEMFQREILKRGQPLTFDYVIDNLKHLHVIDKQIKVIDKHILAYTHLEELVLTGNCITEVHGAHIPSSLIVLELSLNKLSSLQSINDGLTSSLNHVGVSFNQITKLTLTPSKWSSLLSLDVSHNAIADLIGAVSVLEKLPCLKSLIFCGNPAALCQAYCGYVVHALKGLHYIDGEEVTNEARYAYAQTAIDWQESNSLLTSIISVKVTYSFHTSSALMQSELQEGEKGIFIIQFSCSGLHPSCYTESDRSGGASCMLPAEILQRLTPTSHQGQNLLLGPAIAKTIVADPNAEDIEDPIFKTITVNDLVMLKEVVANGFSMKPMLSLVTLQQSKEEQAITSTQHSNHKVVSRGSSPVKPPTGKKPKKTTSSKSKDQESLDGWRVHCLSELELPPIHCNLAPILEGASSVMCRGTIQLPTDKMAGIGLVFAANLSPSTKTHEVTLSVEIAIKLHH